ncbi:MAG TPA: DUF1259 domain-containing protein [Gemmatimonadaceae bacterium]
MTTSHLLRALLYPATVAVVSFQPFAAPTADANAPAPQQAEWQAVETAIGRPGVSQPGGVYRFNFPRTDLRVMIGDVQLKPALALGGWVAFNSSGANAVAVGDLVLLETEVNPVIDALQAGGVEQSAIHHHVLRESPRIIYMHVHGHGDAVKIARAVHAAVARTAIPAPAAPAAAPTSAAEFGIDTAAIAKTLGYAGRVNGGVYQVGVPRAESVRDEGMELPPSMGLSTSINFQPTGAGKAAITGDFVMLASEVNPVIRALRAGGIEITSLHSHMLNEEPRLLFMHFWANDDAVKLARGLRSALDKTNSKR